MASVTEKVYEVSEVYEGTEACIHLGTFGNLGYLVYIVDPEQKT